jgi:serine/threonine-protein kinase
LPILSAEERVGRTLDGKYEIGAPIATGGMGVVYRGKHAWTGRDVAIKVLLPGLSLDAEISRRFLTEARASASLRHPNVVDVLDMGRDEDGTLYMVLELLEGRDLDEVLEERSVLEPAEAIAAIAPALEALAFAHEKGFVHRDIKPSNLYLATDARGVVTTKILDFGIAKALDGGANKATRTGVIIGTPHYMAPEQASGVGVIGPATDTWSIGVVLYEALTGTVPFDGASPTMILMNVLGKRAKPLCSVAADLPPALGALVDGMLEPDPDARPTDLRALARQLRTLLPAGFDEASSLSTLAKPRLDEVSIAAAAPSTRLAPDVRTEPSIGLPEPREPPEVRPASAARGLKSPSTHGSKPWVPLAMGAVALAGLAGAWWWASRGSSAEPPGAVTVTGREAQAEPSAALSPMVTPEPLVAPDPVGAPEPSEEAPDLLHPTSTSPDVSAASRRGEAPSRIPRPTPPAVDPSASVPRAERQAEAQADPRPVPRPERPEPAEARMAPRPITEIQEEF